MDHKEEEVNQYDPIDRDSDDTFDVSLDQQEGTNDDLSKEDRKLLIINALQSAKDFKELEKFLENDDDIIEVLNAGAAQATSRALELDYGKNDLGVHCSYYVVSKLLKGPITRERLNQKYNGDFTGFAVRHIKGYLNRVFLCVQNNYGLAECILDSSLTKDEVTEFLKDISYSSESYGLYGDKPGYNLFRIAGGKFHDAVLNYILNYHDKRAMYKSDELNAKRISVFKEFFDKSKIKTDQLFESALQNHDPELIEAILDMEYECKHLGKANKNEKNKEKTEQYIRDSRHNALLNFLKKREYQDYYRLESTINLLVKKGWFFLKDESTHDFIMDKFQPNSQVALLHLLISPMCNLPITNELAKKLENIPDPDESVSKLRTSLEHVLEIGKAGDPAALLACKFLKDHYLDLDECIKKEMVYYAHFSPLNANFMKEFFDVE